MKLFISVSLIALTAILSPIYAYNTKYVHIVVIDGARYTETFGDSTHRLIPNIWNFLRQRGTIFTKFYNDSITSTVPGHSTIITGVYQNVINDGSIRPNAPTLFEYYRKEQSITDTSETYTILGKDKLNVLSFGLNTDYGNSYRSSVIYSKYQYDDRHTLDNFRYVSSSFHPHITITNLGQVDQCGHSGIWLDYVSAIRQADSIIDKMWLSIQSDPVYKDKTTLFVLNDHGRHTADFSSHGCGCEGCRHIMLLMIGPDTKAGVIDTVRRSQIDIAPTVGELMGFSTPFCKGKSIVPVLPCTVPELGTPKDSSINQPVRMKLDWKPSPRFKHYHIQISSDSLFRHIMYNDSMLTKNSYKVNTLEKGTDYYWHVKSKNSAGAGDWSEIRHFTTVFDTFSVNIKKKPDIKGSVFPVIVNYTLPRESEVIIRLYSADGSLVHTLFRNRQTKSYHSQTFHDISVAKGKYFLDFTAGSYKVKKELLIY